MPIITLTTDFGLHDWFVGVMKGVILGIEPRARIVDLTHDLPAGDLHAGAFSLMAAYRFFPPGTIHLAVVDPGVGGDREAIAVETDHCLFVGPDNGLLSWALRHERVKAIHRLANAAFRLECVSQTFHGRDVFAPAAAHLGRGLPIQRFGAARSDYLRLPWPEPDLAHTPVRGEVVYVDHFGNLITNLPSTCLRDLQPPPTEVRLGPRRRIPLRACYEAVPPGHPVAVAGSCGYLEVAINRGHAARQLRQRVGSPVQLGAGSKQRPGRFSQPKGTLQ